MIPHMTEKRKEYDSLYDFEKKEIKLASLPPCKYGGYHWVCWVSQVEPGMVLMEDIKCHVNRARQVPIYPSYDHPEHCVGW